VLVPGWSQTAAQFRGQLEGLSDRYRVIALDMRGHGDADKPAHGYRIQRLAKDVNDALRALDVQGATVLGHSMGCSVLWCYFDLFGADRVSKFVFCDEPPFLTSNPAWSAQALEDAGAIFSPEAVTQTMNALAGPDGVATTTGFVGGMVTKAMPPATLAWMIEQNLKLPRAHAATLLYNHCHQDLLTERACATAGCSGPTSAGSRARPAPSRGGRARVRLARRPSDWRSRGRPHRASRRRSTGRSRRRTCRSGRQVRRGEERVTGHRGGIGGIGARGARDLDRTPERARSGARAPRGSPDRRTPRPGPDVHRCLGASQRAANASSSALRHAAFVASFAKLASNEFAASWYASARPIDGNAANSAS